MATKDEQEKSRREGQAAGRRRSLEGETRPEARPPEARPPGHAAPATFTEAKFTEARTGPGETPPRPGAQEQRGSDPAAKEEQPMRQREDIAGATGVGATGIGATERGPEGQPARPVATAAREEFLITTAPVTVRQPWLPQQPWAPQPWPPSMAHFPPMDLDGLADQFGGADIEVVEKIMPHGILAVPGDGAPVPPTVVVVRMTPEKALALRSASSGRLLVARNEPLTLADASLSGAWPIFRDPAVVRRLNATVPVTIEVQSKGAPLADAQVYVFGAGTPVEGVTGRDGRVRLRLGGDGEEAVSSLVVIPRGDAWSRHIERPSLDPNVVNVIELRPLSATLVDFPTVLLVGWGERAMRLDQVPAASKGRGVRIALIDSGVATAHPNLKHIRKGFDFPRHDPGRWTEDAVGHGTHCAGIVTASEEGGFGIRGFAPGTESADALAAIVEPYLAKAKAMGIACIVPAGNTAGPIEYPGRSPSVLAVSAIGKLGEFPADSYHAALPLAPAPADGLFFPRFGCFGPEVGVTGPGVAVVSCVPESSFAAWDGTSMAAAHIVGLAALVLAHNPDFQTSLAARNAARVEHLFDVLRRSALSVLPGAPARSGAGLPNAVLALQAGVTHGIVPLTPEQQHEIARRVAEAVQNALSPAVSRSIAAMLGTAGPAPGAGTFGMTGWPPQYY